MSTDLESAIAANRFGIGARPGDPAAIARDPRGWLQRQVADPRAFRIDAAGLTDAKGAALALGAFLEGQRELRARRRADPGKAGDDAMSVPMAPPGQAAEQAAVQGPLRPLVEIARDEAVARVGHGLRTDDGFAERLAWFWANHFTVAASKALVIPFVGCFEREAVRARLTGSFGELLLASTRHPGMLLYLDQAQSIGPGSRIGQRRDVGLNENLAREILELHTVGVDAGFTQADVTEFARALTGWTLAGPRLRRLTGKAEPGSFVFVDALHEPGPRTVLGKRYAQSGESQGLAILDDLARHPATARHVARKLAAHFIADVPPARAVARIEQVFRDSRGDLPAVHRALVDLPEAWEPAPRKFKAPYEFLVSALRLVGVTQLEPRAFVAAQDMLGQPLYRAPSPQGWPDDAVSWAAPDALLKRVEWSQALATRVGARLRPADVAAEALGPLLAARSREAISRASSAAQGLALALMSPEFQRR